VDVKGPSSTWTYLVNDDPFREQVLLSLIGTGGKAVAVYAAVVMPGLFLLWTLVERFARRREGGGDRARADTALVVIDAQRAFVDPAGSLTRTHGPAEVRPASRRWTGCSRFFAAHATRGPAIWVRSEYHPGQFTGGDLRDGMAQVCVPGANVDCEWPAAVRERDVAARPGGHQASRRRLGVGRLSRGDRGRARRRRRPVSR
jgi:hypothetical protein